MSGGGWHPQLQVVEVEARLEGHAVEPEEPPQEAGQARVTWQTAPLRA